MSKNDYPITQGVRFLREKKIDFVPRQYDYQEHGGTARASLLLGVPEEIVVKTLVMETDAGRPLIVLMHGNREVSTKQLARTLGAKSVAPCDVAKTERLTGYSVGGISPFGTRQKMPVYIEKTILALPRIYINGGKRGFLVEVDPKQAQDALAAVAVEVGI
ncbi:MAG: aminoacyl-tRNA deacylase [Acidobacteria bacterium]|nr:MAG: aminoacyl-tRNA deacylase [Acidobacteriota bacterium]